MTVEEIQRLRQRAMFNGPVGRKEVAELCDFTLGLIARRNQFANPRRESRHG
ncbi:hypothetical protein [Enemella dayhoffiae]|uniref:hypothetical protein n=1 Tax=Enemella dayhoffiae TaxID=2016507 RepID=UPI001595FE78|nr:hypothetical protein [Enemella dayhoffiae]